MVRPQEIELKLELPPGRAGHLRSLPLLKNLKPGDVKTVRSVYFDTKKQTLRKNGLSLRIRRIDGRHVQTIKQQQGRSVGLFERCEWEREIDRPRPDLDAARHTALAPLLNKKLRRNLRPAFETRVRRQVFPFDYAGSKIELTVDNGTIKAGRRRARLCEIELELKKGEPARVFALAHSLSESMPVALATKSKGARGYAVAARETPAPVKSEPVALNSEITSATAFQIIARSCLYQLAANEPALLRGDAEAVHQMRVALRRLRTVISLFKHMLSGAQTEAIKSELKWLTSELGPARELDVFAERVIKPAKTSEAGSPAIGEVTEDFHARRLQAINRAEAAVRSSRYRGLLFDAAAWIEVGDWSRRRDERSRTLQERSLGNAAKDELRRRSKKIRKQGAKLAELDARTRHKLRVAAKKLRYACEFFAAAFPGKKAAKRRKKFVARLKAMQGGLGDLNDIVVHEKLAKVAIPPPNASRPARGASKAFTAGRLSGRESARFRGVIQKAKDACGDFAEAKPFWT
jgi:triphosphatase